MRKISQILVAGISLSFSPTYGQVTCDGLSAAQCRLAKIVGTCKAGGKRYVVEEGRVTLNGKLIGTVNDLGDVVDESGEMVTTIKWIMENRCSG